MPFFNNKRKNFSIQPPKQEVSSLPFFVTDSSNIDFTLLNNNLTADLTLTGVIAGTYGDATNIPVLQIDQWGRVTGVTLVPISGGGGGILTLDNGLTLTGTNGQLGGTLIKNTIVDGGASNLMTFTSSRGIPFPTLFIQNTGTGYGQWITAVEIPLKLTTLNATGNSIANILELIRGTSGTPDVGIGQEIQFRIQSTSGAIYTANRLISELTDATPGGFSSKFRLIGNLNNTEEDWLTFYSTGASQLNKYGSGAFTGTAAYNLAVDASGNVIEVTPGGGGGGAIFKSVIRGTPSTPAVESIIDTIFIPANTFATGDIIILNSYTDKSSTGRAWREYFYVNSTPVLAGALLIGRFNSANPSFRWNSVIRSWLVRDATNDSIGYASRVNTGFITTEGAFLINKTSYSIDWTVDNYLIMSVISSIGGGIETVTSEGYWLEKK